MEIKKLGRFEVVDEIGSGGMGIVYKGRDPKINRLVALKVIRPQMSSKRTKEQKQAAERFYVEAQAAGQLSHQNIVTIYDVGEENTREGDLVYIAMEFLDGQGLDHHISDNSFPTLKDKIHIIRQIAEGLDYAHKRGIIHRDVKPANIIITEGNVPKLTDFGLARLSDSSLTMAGTILGTPNYMSPEQVQGKKVDARSDFFALTVIFYEMLTGEKPFGAESITSVIYRVVNDNPILPRKMNAHLPPSVDEMIKKGLAKKPEDRYQNGAEFIRALDGILKESDGKFGPVGDSTIEIEPDETKKRKSITLEGAGLTGKYAYAGMAVAAVAVLAGGVYLFTSSGKPTPPKQEIAATVATAPKAEKPAPPEAAPESTASMATADQGKNEDKAGQAATPSAPQEKKKAEPAPVVKAEKAPAPKPEKQKEQPASKKKAVAKVKPKPQPEAEPKSAPTPVKPEETDVAKAEPPKSEPRKEETPTVVVKHAPTQPEKFGYVDINSEPAGANVFINGKYVGLTPVNNFKVRQGKVEIQVKKQGYATIDKTIQLDDKKQPVTVALLKGQAEEKKAQAPAPAALRGAGLELFVPSGSVIFVDGREYKDEHLKLDDLSEGSHLVYVLVKGGKPFNERIHLKTGERKKIDLR